MVKRLSEIKETASDAVEIIKALGQPEVTKSLREIKAISDTVKEIVESLKDPAIVKNIENVRLAAEAAQTAALKMENSVLKIKETGILEEAKQTFLTTRETIDSLRKSTQSTELVDTMKEMVISIKDLVNEVNLLVAQSSKSGIFREVKEALKEGANVYRNIQE